MGLSAYYNEIDPFAAAWLRELIADNLIAPGEVDERSIEDVTPDDLRPFRQCHFFAGIGVWSLAARRAGWDDDAPIWSGSCPCQPFSAAGKGGGFADERHLWPAFHYLIEQCRPQLIVGEQVAGANGDAWLDLVSADLDATGYAFGAAETCAAGFGAPHIRTRNYWVAHCVGARLEGLAGHGDDRDQPGRVGAVATGYAAARGAPSGLGDACSSTSERNAGAVHRAQEGEHGAGIAVGGAVPVRPEHAGVGAPIGLALDQGGGRGEQRRALEPGDVRHPDGGGRASGGLADAAREDERRRLQRSGESDSTMVRPASEQRHKRSRLLNGQRPGPTNGLWRDPDWLLCRDEKWRPVESGTFPLADAGAFRNRVGLVRGAGNAITLAQAQGFLEAVRASLT